MKWKNLIKWTICLAMAQGLTNVAIAQNQFSAEYYKNKELYDSITAYALGQNEHKVYIFVPENLSQAEQKNLPIVFLHHGWLGMNPLNFGALIDHLARSGYGVIYPVYQQSDATNPQTITQNAVAADQKALQFLAQQGYQINPNRVLYVGFSMGSAISLNIALDKNFYQLPKPKGMVLMAPGDAYHVKHGDEGKSVIGDVRTFPADIPVVVITGSADTSIGVPTARKIAQQLCHLPANQRSLIMLPSDSNGEQTVKAGHGSVGAPDSRYDFKIGDTNFPRTIPRKAQFEESVSLNNLDFYGYWRAIVMLNNSLANGAPEVLGADDVQSLDLGTWQNGQPFKAATVEQWCE